VHESARRADLHRGLLVGQAGVAQGRRDLKGDHAVDVEPPLRVLPVSQCRAHS
jgi:hypothetical protein